MGNNLKAHLGSADKTGVCNLSGKGIIQLPLELQTLSNLRTLDISNNKLKVLPEFIQNFLNLKKLNASRNKITFIHSKIGRNDKLESLESAENLLTSLPPSIVDCKNLKIINLSRNNFQHFPEVLCELKNLNLLDLSKNKIVTLPNNIDKLTVVELNLNQNQLNNLNEKIGHCGNLKVLRVEENLLPISAFNNHILTSSQISCLFVDGNLFDQKAFQNLQGYDQYMERYTATKKKFA